MKCLAEAARQLKQCRDCQILVEGHRESSERPGTSLARANRARDYLINDLGIDAARIAVRNFCDSCLIDEKDPARNRRIEVGIAPASRAPQIRLSRCSPGARLCEESSPKNQIRSVYSRKS
jgi:outer membrane protein OmpA-like peptidoglycan-associated protein